VGAKGRELRAKGRKAATRIHKWAQMIIRFGGFDGFDGFDGFGGLPYINSETKDRDAGTSL
jgi:hypothetical protein